MTKAFGIRAFMLDNLKYLANSKMFESTIICENNNFSEEELQGLKYIPIEMNRGNVSIIEVLRCIWKMYRIFRKEKFDIIQFATSNAGLYASIAGFLAHVPVRIYCQWGISYTDYSGIAKWFYKFAEKITCLGATNIQPDSHANFKFAVEEKLYPIQKGNVILYGSANGVDMQKFDIEKKHRWRDNIRKELSIPSEKRVFGFVGRLVPEKGINELLDAFMKVANSDEVLIIVGPEYEKERLNQELFNKAKNDERIIFVGEKRETAPYYSAMDFLVLPSYREGFGSVVLEAGSLKIPVICSNIKGPTDLVKDGYNGIICQVKSTESLVSAFGRAKKMSAEEISAMGENAYREIKNKFDANVFRQHYLEDRIKILEKHYINHDAMTP